MGLVSLLEKSTPGRRLLDLVKGRPSHPLLERNHAYFSHFDQERPLTDYDFVVVDTELTGLDPAEDEIVSIGAVRIRNMRVDPNDTFYCLVCPTKPLPKNSTLIHYITPEQISCAPAIEMVLPDFVEYLEDSLIVGHHVGLDITFINRALRRSLGAPLRTPCLDTMRLAQVYEAELWENFYDQFNLKVSYQLTDLAKEYGLPLFEKHHAFQDALQTAYLFLFLAKKLKKGGLETLKDLYMAGRSWRWYF